MLADKNIKDFLNETASSAPVPGGGSIAALSGAIACSLTEMVANLTVGKKKYQESWSDMEKIISSVQKSKDQLIRAIDEDSQAFNKVMKSFKLKKDTEDEKKQRSKAIQEATKQAALIPLKVAKDTFEIMENIEEVIKHGNQNAVTDGAVAAMMARTAILSALYNVKINLGSIKDETFLNTVSKEVQEIEEEVQKKERELLNKVKI